MKLRPTPPPPPPPPPPQQDSDLASVQLTNVVRFWCQSTNLEWPQKSPFTEWRRLIINSQLRYVKNFYYKCKSQVKSVHHYISTSVMIDLHINSGPGDITGLKSPRWPLQTGLNGLCLVKSEQDFWDSGTDIPIDFLQLNLVPSYCRKEWPLLSTNQWDFQDLQKYRCYDHYHIN